MRLLRLTPLLLVGFAGGTVTGQEVTPPRASGIELVAHMPLGTQAGDVWVHNQHAYVGSHHCGDALSIINVSDPGNPRLLPALPSDSRATYEDVVVIRAETEHFRGDLLAVGVQPCGRTGTGPRGVHFWDVSDPGKPVELSFFSTGQRSGVHELALRQRDDRIYAYLAVPFSERNGDGGDFRIVDATNPREPVQILDWGVRSRLNLSDSDVHVLGQPTLYAHSVVLSDDSRYAFLSWWDAGYIVLDISDPANPVFLSRIAYTNYDEGNAHSAFVAMDRRLLFAADEDFTIGGTRLEITAPQGFTGILNATELPFGRAGCTVEPFEQEVAFAGNGCGPLAANVAGRIAAFDAGGGCRYDDKVRTAERAGAVGAILAQTQGLTPEPGPAGVSIPAVIVAPADLNRIRSNGRAVRARLEPAPDTTWGYLRIFDLSDLTAPLETGTFKTENTRRCPPPDAGWYTIHNPVVVGDKAYLSWYSDGVRVVDVADPANPREIAHFVPGGPADANPQTLVWGVAVHDGFIYVSDMVNGLWILKLSETPGAEPE